MFSRACLLAFVFVTALPVSARGDVFAEDWDNSTNRNHDWQYWVVGANTGTRPGVLGQNKDMIWSATGGVSDSGYVKSPGMEWFELWDRLWPAYMAPPDRVDDVSLASQFVSVSVHDFGTVALLPTPIELPLHLFVGEWIENGAGLEDDTYVFFQHNAAITVGNNKWAQTTFAVGDDSNWTEIISSPGNTKVPSDLYTNPQQWGFVLNTPSVPDSIVLGFDRLRTVPEPSGFVLLALAMVASGWYGWRRRAAA